MKAGLTYADFLTTVSPTYAHEIQTPAFGYGLQGLLKSRSHQLKGILNGIDYDEYNPQTCLHLPAVFDAKNPENKTIVKEAVQKQLGLPIRADAPMFAMVSRLVEQKGLDLLASDLYEFMNHRDIQLVILGTGHEHFEHMLQNTARYHPDKISANIRFDQALSHQIYAASDFFLMPSLFEPCGLGQIIAMRYGSIPVARKTGGLADTISHYNYDSKKGTGILFEHYDPNGLKWAVDEALTLYAQKDHFNQARQNALLADFSWEASAGEYLGLYGELLGG